ncbi:hypothetical protein S83_062945 [Arachis hypogaea]
MQQSMTWHPKLKQMHHSLEKLAENLWEKVLDVSRIETAPQSMLPIICFRDGSPPLPDALSMTNLAISGINGLDIGCVF